MGDTSSNLNEAGFYPAQQQPLPAAVCGSVPKRAQKHPVGIADIIIDDCSALCQPKFCPKRGIFCLSQHLVGGFSRIHHRRPGKGVRGKGVALALRNVLPTVCRARRPGAPKHGRMRTSAPTSSSQASYPSSRRIRRDSLIPLLVLSPT